mmetsp:Transcript_16085/g.38508  ORF Transcript_16085/g.38508 Transcript_16085/m.38508 type:complete len:182 (-) Transcript_16085:70-615(-)
MLAAVSLMLSSGFLQLIRHRGCHHAHALSQQPRHGVRSSSSRTLQVRCQANCDPSRSEVSLCVTLLSSGSVWRAPALLGRSAGLLTRGLYLRCLVFGLSSAAPAAPAPAAVEAARFDLLREVLLEAREPSLDSMLKAFETTEELTEDSKVWCGFLAVLLFGALIWEAGVAKGEGAVVFAGV